ncbi:complex I subunit 1/NuoH family protein [Roseivirga thermotolerans]|uniref:complex I subunit 1/NuoH family protein n=1 Tax=Roseivirga thermotolerans TaxID=1758176 RepID=UPI00273EBE15|nr:complex I subunit 1 family protein [Roseivirga thermotolerans]
MYAFLFFLNFLLVYTVFAVYAERKISAFIQDRYGPMETGYYGLLQTVADLLKLIQKEDIVPLKADRKLFKPAPVIIFTAVFAGFAVLPLTSGFSGSSAQIGIFYLLAIVSLDVVGILMAGWGSNSKYALWGAMRSVAQIISYEIPLGLMVVCVVLIAQTLNLQEITYQQGIWWGHQKAEAANYLFGIKALGIETTHIGGVLTWNIMRSPLLLIGFVIFFIASLAESNRAPFDIPEAESELVAGFHVEYSGFRWSMIMLAEYGMMLLVAFLASILFLGGWNSPFPNIGGVRLAEWTSGIPGTWPGHLWGVFWMISKALFLVAVQMWIRWTYPRLRLDQLMSLSWKYLTPASILLVLLCAVWRLLML